MAKAAILYFVVNCLALIVEMLGDSVETDCIRLLIAFQIIVKIMKIMALPCYKFL